MTRTERIASLNDLARTAMGLGGQVYQTIGIQNLDTRLQSRIREHVELFKEWTPGNNPHGERDLGAFDIDGERIIWKIDYYDKQYLAKGVEYGSEDPSDPAQTTRVLTIMLAEEY